MRKLISHVFAATLAIAAATESAKADEPFVGEIRSFGFNFCPRNWAPLDGQLLAISSNNALFSLLGTIYGGDGRTTFGLPDLRGRVPVHTGTGSGLSFQRLGSKAGAETVTTTINEMPGHSHSPLGTLGAKLVASNETPSTNNPDGAYFPTGNVNFYASSEGTKQDMAPGLISVDISGEIIGTTGGSQSITNMAPTLVNNYCIALFGIYPSRS
ncbi:phage tail protein [Roseovarius aestuariivivens]|uniref:phage tail protein n=1 Tax=Roseovarius aestuariivivens TaxID=1888910 RepID=UPI0010813BE3|nr:tail fiber protein [Roseovarius aestuariivivens]